MSEIVESSTALSEIKRQGSVLALEVEALVISDRETLEIASSYRRTIKGYLKRADEFMKPILTTTKEALETTRKQWQWLRAPGEAALETIDGKVRHYDAEQRAHAEEERQRSEAERKRLGEEARLKAALEAEASGDSKGAEAILDSPHPPEPVFVPPPVVERVKVEGLHMRSVWEAEVVNLFDLVKAWLDGKAPLKSIVAHLPPLNDLARAHRDTLNIPGVRAIEKRIPAGWHA